LGVAVAVGVGVGVGVAPLRLGLPTTSRSPSLRIGDRHDPSRIMESR
jgi:hypothetical protein